MRIALLFHERDRSRNLLRYDIMHIAKYWLQAGHQVFPVFGTAKFVPADIAILHIDLSLVPGAYVDFANRYEICLNKKAIDIRKTAISRQLLQQGDNYQGQVIIKSNANTAGIPERVNGNWWSRRKFQWNQIGPKRQQQLVIRKASDYRVLENISQVPEEVFSRDDLVVEKFLPERDGDFYCTRTYLFLGDGESCQRNFSGSPIVSWSNSQPTQACEIHPQLALWRKHMEFDYGKFDYVIHDGQAVLLDANKTTGSGDSVGDALVEQDRKKQAEGLLSYYRNALLAG